MAKAKTSKASSARGKAPKAMKIQPVKFNLPTDGDPQPQAGRLPSVRRLGLIATILAVLAVMQVSALSVTGTGDTSGPDVSPTPALSAAERYALAVGSPVALPPEAAVEPMRRDVAFEVTDGIEVVAYQVLLNDEGTPAAIVGTLRNTHPHPVTTGTLHFYARDDAARLIADVDARPLYRVLGAGAEMTFMAPLPSEMPTTEWFSEVVAVACPWTEADSATIAGADALELRDVSEFIREDDAFLITGTIANPSDLEVANVAVSVSVFGPDGAFVGSITHYPEENALLPGATVSFSLDNNIGEFHALDPLVFVGPDYTYEIAVGIDTETGDGC